jgi:hypothetical protein
VARALALPLPLVRALFVLGLLFHLAGLLVYLALWLAMPLAPGGMPPYRKAVAWVARQLLRLMGGTGPRAPGARENGGRGPAAEDGPAAAGPGSLDVSS